MCRALGSLGPIGLPVSRPSLLHPLFSLCPCSPVLPFVLRALTPNGNLPSLGFHRPAQVPRFLLSSQQLTIQWSTPTTWLSNIVVITPSFFFFFHPSLHFVSSPAISPRCVAPHTNGSSAFSSYLSATSPPPPDPSSLFRICVNQPCTRLFACVYIFNINFD